jgi:hypothetical protein
MIDKILCWWLGHDWKWMYDDRDFHIYKAGNCQRCGEVGDGIEPLIPRYYGDSISEGIVTKGM